jgi:hypothetical protein
MDGNFGDLGQSMNLKKIEFEVKILKEKFLIKASEFLKVEL